MKNSILFSLFIICFSNTCYSQAVVLTFQTQTHFDTIKASWITQSETNVDYFILQRTFAGNGVFSDRDTINAVGNSTVNQLYFYDDIPQLVDTCYLYRLKVVETNGLFAFTSIVIGCVFLPASVVESENEIKTKIYPNPSSGSFLFKSCRIINTGILKVLNSFGETLYSRNISNESEFEINLSNISSGVYFLNLNDGARNYRQKIIIQKL